MDDLEELIEAMTKDGLSEFQYSIEGKNEWKAVLKQLSSLAAAAPAPQRNKAVERPGGRKASAFARRGVL